MRLHEVMDAVADRLKSIPKLNVYSWVTGSISSPAACVSFPEEYTFDSSYGRGSDQITLPVQVMLANPVEKTTRDLMSAYVDGSGSRSIKAVLESGEYTAFDSIRVVDVVFAAVKYNDIDYLMADFSCDIIGSGA